MMLQQMVFGFNTMGPLFIAVRNYLHDNFPNRRIGRRRSTRWPPHSPDLTPQDYFFWGYLKSRVYVDRLNIKMYLVPLQNFTLQKHSRTHKTYNRKSVQKVMVTHFVTVGNLLVVYDSFR